MESVIGFGFKLPNDGIRGSVNLKGLNFEYRCLSGQGLKGEIVEVISYESNELLVEPTQKIKERDVNYIDYR